MFKNKNRLNYKTHLRRNNIIRLGALAVIAAVLVMGLVLLFTGWRNQPGNERQTLLRLWDEGAYEEVFEVSKTALAAKPLDYFLLTIHGFSAYQIGIAQINNFDTLTYIDECIWSLRKALLSKNSAVNNRANNGRVYYVLGKAYYYKGADFADLAVKYLEEAREASYAAGDTPEYLGLSYAAIHDYRSSVAAFTLALDPAGGGDEVSDRFLLAIASSYTALGEQDMARAYLLRCIETSRDFHAVILARLDLAGILAAQGKSEEAEAQYLIIVNENGENAEARYQLGELYAARGDNTRARAEWRRAVRTDPAHPGARQRLGM
jgi:tetratricopeptide (TPR) repeat protein